MMTGANADTAALVMIYVQRDMRRRGVARSLLTAGSDLLRQRGVSQALTHVSSGSAQQMGLIRMMSGTRRKIISILPNLPFG
jgi:GNAT superfamily N-acetyltransferase